MIRRQLILCLILIFACLTLPAAYAEKEPITQSPGKIYTLNSQTPSLKAITPDSLFTLWEYNQEGLKVKSPHLVPLDKIGFKNQQCVSQGKDFCRVSLRTPGIIYFSREASFSIYGTVEIAGMGAYIQPKTNVTVHQGLRLGFDTSDLYYDFPMNLARYENTYPTQLYILGQLKILQVTQSYKPFLEANTSHIQVLDQGQLSLGEASPGSKSGCYSKNSDITLFDSVFDTPMIQSEGDLIRIIGSVTFITTSKEASRLKSHVRLEAEDSYHASELLNSVNRTLFKLKGNIEIEGTLTYVLGCNKEFGLSLPQISCTGSVDFSKGKIEIDDTILERQDFADAKLSDDNQWPLIYSSVTITKLPMLVDKKNPKRKLKYALKLSDDQHTVYLMILKK